MYYKTSMLFFSMFLATSFPVQFVMPDVTPAAAKLEIAAAVTPVFGNFVEFSVFSNDSVADLTYFGQETRLAMHDSIQSIETTVFTRACYRVVVDSLLYFQHWDTLPQPRFWRAVMNMHRDSAIVNLGKSRTIIETVAMRDWNSRSEARQEAYKDSIRNHYGLLADESVYLTTGKNHFYEFEKALPTIGQGIKVFESRGVDPWYAQAILLIESPGKSLESPVGAYGSFQLMPEVALEQGLIVNDSIDERADFDKSAQAAAALLGMRCIPQIKHILRKRDIDFSETDIWFRLMVLHAYHAGAGNVQGVIDQIEPVNGGMWLIQRMWQTQYGGFKNASQNYSQIALASFMELDALMQHADTLCVKANQEL